MLDYYQILGVSPSATQKEIVAAYRAKCKELHPDVNPSSDATAQMQLVNEAYQVLSDSILRRQHDAQHVDSSDESEDSAANYAQEFYNAAWWYQTYKPPSWYEHPIDVWYERHKDDKKIHIPSWVAQAVAFWLSFVLFLLHLGRIIING